MSSLGFSFGSLNHHYGEVVLCRSARRVFISLRIRAQHQPPTGALRNAISGVPQWSNVRPLYS